MKTPQNAPFCIKSTTKILGGGGGQTPPDPPPFPGLVACTAKKASYAPVRVTGAHGTELPPFFLTVCLLGYFQSISLLSGKRDEILKK
jgi:hypothetical protein